MIKSKNKSTMYPKKEARNAYVVDSYQSWYYSGNSKNLGEKYKSVNSLVTNSGFIVNKRSVTGIDLPDA